MGDRRKRDPMVEARYAAKRRGQSAAKRSATEQVLRDAALAMHCDSGRSIAHPDVVHRYEKFVEAVAAIHEREEGCLFAFRQQLIELASACLTIAASMPPADRATPPEPSTVANINRAVPDLDELAVAA